MSETPVVITFGKNGETLSFNNLVEFNEYLASQEFLGWIDILRNSVHYSHIDSARNRVVYEARNFVASYNLAAMPSYMADAMTAKPFPTGRTYLAKAIQTIAETDVEHAAHVLMCAADIGTGYSSEAAKGAAELLLIEKGMSKASTESTIIAMNVLSQEFRDRIEGARSAAAFQADQHRDMIASHQQEFKLALDREVEIMVSAVADHHQAVADALEKIENTRKAYIEHMALDASVKYWTAKKDRHRDILSKGLLSLEKRVPGYFFGACVIVGIYITCFAAPNVTAAEPEKALLFGTLGVFITSMILWYGRLLTRQLISQRHLLEDAEERVVMIKSYIAMTKEGHVSKEDRVLALGAAFKSAGSGHPSDDGSSDISTAAIIGRLVQNDKPA